jgi:hypothetical protein
VGFFFRPGINVGPVRLNFSTKGVGISTGTAGARVGVSPGMRPFVGTSVGGAVYRKYLDENGKSKKRRQGKGNGHQGPADEQHHFVDSGNTYQSPVQQSSVRKVKPPSLPRVVPVAVAIGLVIGVGVLLAYLTQPLSLGFWVGLGLTAGSAGWAVYTEVFNRRAHKQLDHLKAQLDQEQPIEALQTALNEIQLPDRQRHWRDLWLYVALITAYFEDRLSLTAEGLEALERQLAVQSGTAQQVKQVVFAEMLNQTLEDHVISEDEQAELSALQKVLGLSDDAIEQELQTIKAMADIREQMQQGPQPVEADVNLKQGETCYYCTEGRILKEKILNRYQADNIIHKEIGYDTEMEGTLYLTDRRLLLVSDGAREYRLNTILDVTLSLEDNTVQLTIEKRKSPVILTTPHTPLLAGKLEQLLELEEPEE